MFRFSICCCACWFTLIAVGQTTYEAGKDAYYAGDYATADSLFQLAVVEARNANDTINWTKAVKRRGDVANRQRDFMSALDFYDQTERLLRQRYPLDTLFLADVELKRGHTYSSMYLPNRADSAYRRALIGYEQQLGPASSEVGNIHMSWGINANKRGDYPAAERHFARAEAIFLQGPPQSKDRYRIASNRGVNFRKMGDYDRALLYAERALRGKLTHYDSTHPSVPKYYRNIGRILQEQGKYDAALPYFERALRMQRAAAGPEHTNTLGALAELGNIYADLGRREEALHSYRQAMAGMETQYAPTHPYLVGGFFNIGRVYEDAGDYANARRQYQEALRRFLFSAEPVPEKVANTYGQLAHTYQAEGQLDSAEVLLKMALVTLTDDRALSAPGENPRLESVAARQSLLRLLIRKVELFRVKTTAEANPQRLKTAFQTNELALQLVRQMRNSFPDESSRQSLRERTDGLYETGIELAHQLYLLTNDADYLRAALRIANDAKAALLRDQLDERQIRRIGQLPPASIAALETVEAELRQARRAEDFGTIRAAERRFTELQTELERQHPRYAELRLEQDFAPAELQAQLDERSALLDYFLTDSTLYVLLVRRQRIVQHCAPLPAGFSDYLIALRPENLGTLVGNSTELRRYRAANVALYELLVEPLLPHLAGTDRLIVSPHRELYRLSFAALSPHDGSYLLEQFALRYAPAPDLAFGDQKESSAFERELLGSAPLFADGASVALASGFRAELQPLPHTETEVRAAARYWSGAVQVGAAARRAAFVAAAPRTRLLHLATHGRLNDTDPLQSGLFFAGVTDSVEFLSALDVYELSLDADLAILSACDTGDGPLQTGEGAMSLGRAFRYAGCRSVMLSRWLANDRATAHILADFHAGLDEGLARDVALQRAQLNYLHTAEPLARHPYFWAGLVLEGAAEPMVRSWGGFVYWLVGSLLVGLMGAALWRYRV